MSTSTRRSDRVIPRSQLIARRPTCASAASSASAVKTAQAKLNANLIAKMTVADLKAQQAAKDQVSHEKAMAIFKEEANRLDDDEDDIEDASTRGHEEPESLVVTKANLGLAALEDDFDSQSFLVTSGSSLHKATSDSEKPDLFGSDTSDVENDVEIVDNTNPRKRRKSSNRPVDDGIPVPSENVPRTPSSCKIVLGRFPRNQHGFLNHCRLIARLFTANRESYLGLLDKERKVIAMMKFTAYESKWACLDYQASFNKINDNLEVRKDAIEYIDYTAQAMRSSVMAHTRLYMYLLGLPATGCSSSDETTRVTADNAQWILEKLHFIYGELDVKAKTYNRMLPVQADWFVNVIADFYFSKRSKLDMEAFIEVMEQQAVPISFLSLVGACIGHGVGEYSSGHFEAKHFTMAAASTYNEIHDKLVGYERQFPNLILEWRQKLFQAACAKANKMWLIKSSIPEDDEELTRAFGEAEAAATARRGH